MNDAKNPTNPVDELSGLLSFFMTAAMRNDTDMLLRFLKREDMTLSLLSALCVVERQGKVSIGELGTTLDFSLANASLLVDKLVCNGCVTRVEDMQDRRQKLVQLTPKGHALVAELRSARADDVARHLRQLPPDVLLRTLTVLREVTTELEQCQRRPAMEKIIAAE